MKSLAAQAGALRHTAEIMKSVACASTSSDDDTDLCAQPHTQSDILLSRKVTAVVQHHDSITGTSKPDVTADLDVRLRVRHPDIIVTQLDYNCTY